MTYSVGISGIFRKDRLAGGVYSYFENLLRGFVELNATTDAAWPIDLTVFHGAAGLPWRPEQVKFRPISDRFGRFPAEAKVGREVAGMDAALFTNYFTPPVVRANRAVTVIHDLQYGHLSRYHPLRKRIWLDLCHSWTLRRCDAVITISSAVKDDIVARFGSKSADRLHVIWNPVSLERFDSTDRRDFSGGRPYVLCVAMDRPQKNLFTLVRAFDLLKHKFPDHCLVMAGQLRSLRKVRHHRSKHFTERMPSTVDLVRDLGLQDRVIVTGFVSDAELGSLYRDAALFVLPSVFEGFGMPAVESISLGTPTVVSDIPVLREVTLNSAQYVSDPRSSDEWAQVMACALNNPDRYRPAAGVVAELRRRVAPKTVAQQYAEILKNHQAA